ncbi:MAG: transposase [Limisphaerales bacterium]
MNCPKCGSGSKKFGRFITRNGSVQRYRCKYCGRTFNDLHAFTSVRLDDAKVAQIVQCLTDGCGIRATARLSGCDKNTVLGVLRTVGEKCQKFHDQIGPASSPTIGPLWPCLWLLTTSSNAIPRLARRLPCVQSSRTMLWTPAELIQRVSETI